VALLFHLAATTLGVAGIAKVVSPASSHRALEALSPGAGRLARGLGGAEAGLAVGAVLMGGRVAAAAVALAYAGLAMVAVRLARRAPDAPCGCFGASTTPPSAVHVAIDLVFAAVGTVAVFAPVPSAGGVVSALGGWTLPYAQLVAAATFAIVLVGTARDDLVRELARP
jgi:hypothetical protein